MTPYLKAWNFLSLLQHHLAGIQLKITRFSVFVWHWRFIKSTINYVITAADSQLEFSQRQLWIRFDAFYSYEPQIEFTAVLEFRDAVF